MNIVDNELALFDCTYYTDSKRATYSMWYKTTSSCNKYMPFINSIKSNFIKTIILYIIYYIAISNNYLLLCSTCTVERLNFINNDELSRFGNEWTKIVIAKRYDVFYNSILLIIGAIELFWCVFNIYNVPFYFHMLFILLVTNNIYNNINYKATLVKEKIAYIEFVYYLEKALYFFYLILK
jgi:hypothetical protein